MEIPKITNKINSAFFFICRIEQKIKKRKENLKIFPLIGFLYIVGIDGYKTMTTILRNRTQRVNDEKNTHNNE